MLLQWTRRSRVCSLTSGIKISKVMDYALLFLLILAVAVGAWHLLSTRRATVAEALRQKKIISRMNSLYERAQIQEASAEARAAIPLLRELFSARPERASVLVCYQPPTGPSE